MQIVQQYCDFAAKLDSDNVHKLYHDTQYGFPIHNDDELFCRLVLEINQAGLSWTTILKKQDNFRKAYSNFSVQEVANYTDKDIHRLLSNPGIIRNKLKINAAIYNANRILELQSEYGSFKEWLDHHHPLSLKEWIGLFKKNFKFTGGEITNEFLMSTGYLPGAHVENCPIHLSVLKEKPMWASKSN